MILCVDVGNSNIVADLFDKDGVLQNHLRTAYTKGLSAGEYTPFLKEKLESKGMDISKISHSVLCCSNPVTRPGILGALTELIGKEPILFKNDEMCRLNILTEDPNEVGVDIIASCMAAKDLYPMPCVIVDMGTATTVTGMDKNGNVLGVSILPGMFTALNALLEKTGLPWEEKLNAAPKAIGRNTQQSMESGILLGNACAVEGMIAAFEEEIGEKCTAVATGGASQFIVHRCKRDIILDNDLLLEGLYCYYKNSTM